MSKFIILLVVVAAFVSSNADENFPDFPNFQMLEPLAFTGGFPEQAFAILNPDYIKNLKPGPGQTVSGASVSSSSSSETVDGVTHKQSSGRVVTNEDGKVSDVSF